MYYSEKFNSYTHLLGLLLAIAGTSILITFSALKSGATAVVSTSIYGSMLILLYGCSTLYHSIYGPVKKIFQKLDHASIYLLIAGTYTPFALVSLQGGWGWTLFGLIWGLAVLGILQEYWPEKRTRVISYVLYLLMGWMVIIAINPLLRALPIAGFAWLAAGGVFYTFGLIFYALDGKIPHAHGFWHLCVLLGSACQYLSILRYVI